MSSEQEDEPTSVTRSRSLQEQCDRAGSPGRPAVNRRLYVSHFLSTWNSRSFEFGATLFLAAAFPGSLLQVSIYAIVRSAAAILFSPAVGRYVDAGNRLSVVRTSIVHYFRGVVLTGLCLLAAIEKLSSTLNLVAVERDWVIVISGDNEPLLQTLNAQMRRIDLFCKLAGPTSIALVDGWLGSITAVTLTLSVNVIALPIEYLTIAWVYRSVPALAGGSALAEAEDGEEGASPLHYETARDGSDDDGNDSSSEDVTTGIDREPSETTALIPKPAVSSTTRSLLRGLGQVYLQLHRQAHDYVSSPVFLPSLCLSLLYLNVLSFNGQTVAFLLNAGLTSWHVGLLRLVSISVELLATWVGPLVSRRIGSIRAGMWFVNWELVCLVLATVYFFPRSGGGGNSSVSDPSKLVEVSRLPPATGAEDAIAGSRALFISSAAIRRFTSVENLVVPWPRSSMTMTSVEKALKEMVSAAGGAAASPLLALQALPALQLLQHRLVPSRFRSAASAPALQRSVLQTARSARTSSLSAGAGACYHPPALGGGGSAAAVEEKMETLRATAWRAGGAVVAAASASAANPAAAVAETCWPAGQHIPEADVTVREPVGSSASDSAVPENENTPRTTVVAAAVVLACGIILSRLGLWGFDLSAQALVQAGVARQQRGSFSATEAALQSFFELAAFASTAVWPRPSEFRFPVLVSVAAVGLAAVLYAGYVRRARGHLLHLPCGGVHAGAGRKQQQDDEVLAVARVPAGEDADGDGDGSREREGGNETDAR